MSAFAHHIAAVRGVAARVGDFFLLFSMRLDETGTDNHSRFVTVGGGVALPMQWDGLESHWGKKMTSRGIDYFHLVDFDQGKSHYEGWSNLKRRLFEKALHKIVKQNTTFRCAVSVDSKAHAEVKRRMRGITGFHPDSDYSLCLRWLMFAVSEQLLAIEPDHRLAVIVEDGPWVAGASATYQKVARMQGPWRPARHAHRLAGFTSHPKGVLRSLEAADFIVGREHDRLVAGRPAAKEDSVLSHLLSADDLEGWYQGMVAEKEARRAYHRSKKEA